MKTFGNFNPDLSRPQYIDSLEQDWSNCSALAMELLQSCTKPSISSLSIGGHMDTCILGRELGPSGVSPNQRSRWKHAFSPLKHV